jgi:hypothetical protein
MIAVIANVSSSSGLWLLDAKVVQVGLNDSYVPVQCTRGGGGLACAAGNTSHWLGCGLQLDISDNAGQTVVIDGISCTSIALDMS